LRTVFIFLGLTVIPLHVLFGQSESRHDGFTREIELVAENDIFFYEDYYYTAGQDISYRRLVRPSSWLFKSFTGKKKDSAKVIVQYHGGIKIFNPFDIDAATPAGMDRPYAGWTSGSAAVSTFRSPHAGNHYELETGVVGEISGMERLQLWVHKITNYDPPSGWPYQIHNEWVVNTYYSHMHEWVLSKGADIVSQSLVQAGTGGNKFSQDVTLRLIHFNPINNSAFTQSRLTWNSSGNQKNEIFLFVGGGADVVATNIFIEGSLFKNNPSPFTVQAIPVVFRRTIGLMFSSRRISLSATIYHLWREVPNGRVHDYASLRLGVRL
jgi:lipid A 3-O-deacylase